LKPTFNTSDSFTSTWLVASCAVDRKLPNERMVNRVITLNWFESSKRPEAASRLQRTHGVNTAIVGPEKPLFIICHWTFVIWIFCRESEIQMWVSSYEQLSK